MQWVSRFGHKVGGNGRKADVVRGPLWWPAVSGRSPFWFIWALGTGSMVMRTTWYHIFLRLGSKMVGVGGRERDVGPPIVAAMGNFLPPLPGLRCCCSPPPPRPASKYVLKQPWPAQHQPRPPSQEFSWETFHLLPSRCRLSCLFSKLLLCSRAVPIGQSSPLLWDQTQAVGSSGQQGTGGGSGELEEPPCASPMGSANLGGGPERPYHIRCLSLQPGPEDKLSELWGSASFLLLFSSLQMGSWKVQFLLTLQVLFILQLVAWMPRFPLHHKGAQADLRTETCCNCLFFSIFKHFWQPNSAEPKDGALWMSPVVSVCAEREALESSRPSSDSSQTRSCSWAKPGRRVIVRYTCVDYVPLCD